MSEIYYSQTDKTAKKQDELTGPICTKWAGQPVCVYESVDSTNLEATRLAKEGASCGTVVVANMQTAGRGRRGRTWESPAGNHLYFSLLLRPKLTPPKAPMLTLVMAVAAARGIRGLIGCEPGIKWPNDLVMNGRKICGILTEMRLVQNASAQSFATGEPSADAGGYGIDHVVIGVGINVGQRIFSGELEDKATSLEAVCGYEVNRKKLLEAVLTAFEELYEIFLKAGDLRPLLEEYNHLLVNQNQSVTVLDPQGSYNGIAEGITRTGELVVKTEDGSCREVFAGEVSVRGIYGYV